MAAGEGELEEEEVAAQSLLLSLLSIGDPYAAYLLGTGGGMGGI
jgi:hypothetical protein